MSVTSADIQAFTDYAHARISNGGAESMAQLFRDWLARRDADDVHAAIREGLADIEAGRTRPVSEFMAEVRSKLSRESE